MKSSSFDLTEDQLYLLYNIYHGLLHPVRSLIDKDELQLILDSYVFRGETYALPYLFFVDDVEYAEELDLFFDGKIVGTLSSVSTYTIPHLQVAESIFGTTSVDHPGVRDLLCNKDKVCLAAEINSLNIPLSIPHSEVKMVRDTVFQSRNPPHSAHEFIIRKYAPNLTYTTPFRTVKATDYSFDLKIRAYQKIQELYQVDVMVTTLPRVFGGPREALQNCIIFQNLGAKRMIMGRNKNCVGDFYRPTESYELCREFFADGKIEIEPVWEDTLYAFGEEIKASSIKAKYIDRGICPPEELMSPPVSEILLCKEC